MAEFGLWLIFIIMFLRSLWRSKYPSSNSNVSVAYLQFFKPMLTWVVCNQVSLGLFTTDSILDSFLKICYTKRFCLENLLCFCFKLYYLFSVSDISNPPMTERYHQRWEGTKTQKEDIYRYALLPIYTKRMWLSLILKTMYIGLSHWFKKGSWDSCTIKIWTIPHY